MAARGRDAKEAEAEASAATVPLPAKLWVSVNGGSPSRVPTAECEIIDDFRKAIKTAFDPDLNAFSASRLSIRYHDAAENDHLDEAFLLTSIKPGAGIRKRTALMVTTVEPAAGVGGLRPARPAWNKGAFVVYCNNGNLARVRELTSPEHMATHRGVDLNWMMHDRATALYLACFEGHIEVVRYLTSPAMLAAGIDVNKAGSDGSPPLAAAAWLDRVEVARHLLESPDLAAAGITVDVNAGAEDGQTALRRACVWRASPEVVSLLLRQPQLDIDARGKGGLTALQLAEANTRPGEHGAEKAALIRVAMRLPMARRYVLVVTMWSRREGRAVAPALPGGTLDEEDEEARGRRRVMGGLPRFMLEAVCRLASM